MILTRINLIIFGINYLEAENKRNFQDLSISNDSKEIRNLYEDILEDNIIIKKIKIDQEPFYKKRFKSCI